MSRRAYTLTEMIVLVGLVSLVATFFALTGAATSWV